jgi:trehalose-6-phosphate synthase
VHAWRLRKEPLVYHDRGDEWQGYCSWTTMLIVASNREPYLHQTAEDGSIGAIATAGGVAVALDALMRERGGTWIAHGAGDADREVCDDRDRVQVPPGAPTYELHRIWLTEDEERRYYGGFCNEGLWPLCHMVHVKPIFRAEDWAAYQAVNRRFAEAIAADLTQASPPVFIQDYHLALVAAELHRLKPAARTALFWHIPWPHVDQLRMCPWRRVLLEGLLANDQLAFQVERDRRNFLTAVHDELGLDTTRGIVRTGSHTTTVVAAPISVDFDRINGIARDPRLLIEKERLSRELGMSRPIVGIGVDRLDYTKGIPERLDAIDRLLTARPELKTEMVFVQIGVPSRSTLASYAAIEKEIDDKVADINTRHGRGPADGPIRYRKTALKLRRLVALYQLADFCIVSPLHDGMNLVAKEFVAARHDEGGVLILSELAGAAQELKDAVIINPYDADGFTAAIARAIEMPAGEQAARMRRMRRAVSGHDVFVWASEILDNLERRRVA